MTDTRTDAPNRAATGPASGDGGDPPADPPRRRRRRRRPAPKAHPFFQFVFPLVVVAAAVAVLFLWREGSNAVLDSSDGLDVTGVDDPSAPGYLAFVDPTPTLLLAHVDDNDTLVGVSVLARTGLERGGSLTLLSPDLLVGDGDESILLGPTYADGGIEALEAAVGEFFGFGFTEDSLVFSPLMLEEWFTLVEPVPFRLKDDLIEVDADGVETVAFGADAREFASDELAEIYGWRNDSEFDAQRFERQRDIWKAWVEQIAAADDLMAATLVFAEGLSPFLRSLAAVADIELVPMEAVSFGAEPVYFLADGQEDWPAARTVGTVGLPIGFEPGARPIVRLLDGVGDITLRDAALEMVAAGGAEITVIGNADAFGVTSTVVAYHRPGAEAAATALAQAIGAEVQFEELLDEPADLTVTIGSDMENA